MVCIGATIGKSGFTSQEISCNQQINTITPKEKYAPKIFYYALISPNVQKRIIAEGTRSQATLPIINKTKWSSVKVNLPISKEQQEELVALFDELSASTVLLKKTFRHKLAELETLRKSILQKAFTGKLIAKEFEA